MPPPRGGGRHAQDIRDLYVQLAECDALFQQKCMPKIPSCDQNCRNNFAMAAVAGMTLLTACLMRPMLR
jgi:hypothetical protein